MAAQVRLPTPPARQSDPSSSSTQLIRVLTLQEYYKGNTAQQQQQQYGAPPQMQGHGAQDRGMFSHGQQQQPQYGGGGYGAPPPPQQGCQSNSLPYTSIHLFRLTPNHGNADYPPQQPQMAYGGQQPYYPQQQMPQQASSLSFSPLSLPSFHPTPKSC
jgi:hypothetical protein